MLENDVLKLRLIEPEDYETIRNWRTDAQEYNSFFEFRPVTKKQNEMFYEKHSDEFNFCIVYKKTNEVIGTISIVDLDTRSRKAEMGRILIGDKKYRGQGLMKSAIELVKEYAFKNLNLRKLYCTVFEKNLPAQKTYTSCGFKQEAVLKEHIYKNGKYENVLIFSLFREN